MSSPDHDTRRFNISEATELLQSAPIFGRDVGLAYTECRIGETKGQSKDLVPFIEVALLGDVGPVRKR
jgi:hypothetical protein